MTDHRTDTQDVFDIANWLERATSRRDEAPTPRASVVPAPPQEYVPRHRADIAADSVA